MISFEDLNDTTKNLIKALEEFVPVNPKPIVYKLTYDKETGIVNGCTIDENVDLPWVEISKEQYLSGMPYRRLRVVNGKIEEIKQDSIKQLSLVEGNRWYTNKSNMLIIGNDNGWDERKNN